jgi:hypothetical protein|tara:strand:- start:12586 stop:12720 length:135 start_codon:yes stop_codon:yes gene_type:complete
MSGSFAVKWSGNDIMGDIGKEAGAVDATMPAISGKTMEPEYNTV